MISNDEAERPQPRSQRQGQTVRHRLSNHLEGYSLQDQPTNSDDDATHHKLMVKNRAASQNDIEDKESNVTNISIQAGVALSDLLRPTFGPTGRDKMIVDSNQMVIITNNGATILGEVDVEMDIIPSARLITELVQSQGERFGDGTKTATIFAGELMRRAETLVEKGLHPSSIVDGYLWASDRTADLMAQHSFEVTVNNTEHLEHVAKVAMTGRGTTAIGDTLANLVVEAVRTVEQDGDINLDYITTTTIPGGVVGDSVLYSGVLIDTTDPVLTSMPRAVEDARIACVDAPIQPTGARRGSAEIHFERPEDVTQFHDYEYSAAEQLVNELVDHGVNVVFCTKDISQKTRLLLSENGILATKRTLSQDVEQIARATGASAISDIYELEPSDIGLADRVELRQFGREQLFTIEGCEDPRSATLLLRGGIEHSLDEVERTVRNGIATVRATIQSGCLVPGAGAVETEVGRILRAEANDIADRRQLAIRAYADALEVIPRTLAVNMGHDPIDTLVELRRRHDMNHRNAGVVPDEGVVDDVVEAGIVEPHNVKLQAIIGASEVVFQVLKIDDVIPAKLSDEPY